MCGGQETAKELNSEIEIIRGCFTERGDSILSLLLQAVTRAN